MKFLKVFILIFILSGCETISVKKDDVDPAAIEKDVNAATDEDTGGGKALGSYTTIFSEKSGGRTHNIKLAASKLNETRIESGGVFSYNESIGPMGKSAGFKKARIFVNGKDAEGYGGGVCQVSSTLYNAALAAGLPIVERHQHSKPVGYVPEGKDATTSYGGADFKFKNDTGAPLVVMATASEGKVTVEIKKA